MCTRKRTICCKFSLQTLAQIKQGLKNLRFPDRNVTKSAGLAGGITGGVGGPKKSVGRGVEMGDSKQSERLPLNRHWSDIPCCLFTRKALDRILIRFVMHICIVIIITFLNVHKQVYLIVNSNW